MSKDTEKPVQKQVAGSLKEAIGKVTGDEKMQSEGAAAQKAGASLQKASEKSA